MKLQLLLLVCLAVLASGLATGKSSRRPSRRALNSAPAFRAVKAGMQARDDDDYICEFSTCWEIDYDEPCFSHSDCDDDELCLRGFCSEYEGGFCRRDRDCYYFDDDDDDK